MNEKKKEKKKEGGGHDRIYSWPRLNEWGIEAEWRGIGRES
jgi:hypothetical protein